MRANDTHSTALLHRVRVIDLSQYIPGPYATRLMADLGADVIKIEPPGGDPMRRILSDKNEPSPLYLQLNRGKRVQFVDLKSRSGKAAFSRLIEGCDVLLDGFRPGTLDGLGFGFDRLESINAGLIYCGLSGFGQTGPDADKAGHDVGYCAAAGLYGHAGPARPPAIPFPPLADHVGSLQAVNSILAALVYKRRTGQGCHLDVSLYESILSWQYFSQTPGVIDMLSGGAAYYNIYATADGRFLALGAIEEKFWSAFCGALDRKAWVDRYHDAFPQVDLKQAVSRVLKAGSLDEWLRVFEHVDCCLEPVLRGNEVFRSDQTRARGLFDGQAASYPARINFQATPVHHRESDLDGRQCRQWRMR